MSHLPALLYNLFSSGFPPERIRDRVAGGIERLLKHIAIVCHMDKSFVLSFDYDAENRSEASDSRLNLERYNIESDSYNIKLMLVSRIMVNSE
jgi:hypothetical protein